MWLVRIQILLFGVAAAVVLTFVALLIDRYVRPDREILLGGLKNLVYIFVLLMGSIAGGAVSLAVMFSPSLKIAIIASFLIAITISIDLIRGALEISSHADYFDAPMFYADVLQIGFNLVIYPSVCFLTWKVFADKLIRTS